MNYISFESIAEKDCTYIPARTFEIYTMFKGACPIAVTSEI